MKTTTAPQSGTPTPQAGAGAPAGADARGRAAKTSKSATKWTNWCRLYRSEPADVVTPRDETELAALLARATEENRTVRPVGGSHSFTPLAHTDDILLDMRHFRGLYAVDPVGGTVTLGAGTHLWELPGLLEPYGLALANMGDIDRQTIGGALSTSTHGTGLAYTGYAGMIRALRIALPTGDIVTASPTQHPELFEAARVGLGALSVIVHATIDVVPSFILHAEERPVPLADTLENFIDLSREQDHVEFYWFQHTDVVARKINRRSPGFEGDKPLSGFKHWFEDELLNNGGHRAICELGKLIPKTVPALNKLAARTMGNRSYADTSHKVFVSPRRTRFREMEYAIHIDDYQEVFSEVVRAVNAFPEGITFPLEVRAAKGDDVWLSTAHGRDSVYIAVHRFYREEHKKYFAVLEDIFKAAGGRPHWGKLHTLSPEDLHERYPKFGDWLKVREQVDPNGILLNDYLAKMLGV